MYETSVPNHILSVLLLESFRYCLGRQTYAVSECVKRLQLYWHVLPDYLQRQIQRDIRAAIARGNAGSPNIDVPEWEKVLDLRVAPGLCAPQEIATEE